MRYLVLLLALLLAPAQAGVTGNWNSSNHATEPTSVINVPCSISAWVISGAGNANATAVSLSDADDDTGFSLCHNSGGAFWAAETEDSSGATSSIFAKGKGISTTLIRHVLVVFHANNDRRVYVDGFGGNNTSTRTIDSVIDTLGLGVDMDNGAPQQTASPGSGDASAASHAQADDGPGAPNLYIHESIWRGDADREARYNASHFGTNTGSRTTTLWSAVAIGGREDSTPDLWASTTVLRTLLLNAEPTDSERRRLYRLLDHLYGPMYDHGDQPWPIGAFDP